jgi:hypothetical protein
MAKYIERWPAPTTDEAAIGIHSLNYSMRADGSDKKWMAEISPTAIGIAETREKAVMLAHRIHTEKTYVANPVYGVWITNVDCREIISKDGVTWTDWQGNSVDSPAFRAAKIRLREGVKP